MYFLSQKPAEALSKAARYDMGNIWAALTIDDWKVAIKNKSTFVRCVTNFDSKDCLEYAP